MATTQTLPTQPVAPSPTTEIARQAELEGEQALAASPHTPDAGQGIALTPAIALLPVELDVSVPVRDFRVRNLLALEPGSVIETQWGHGEDMPLSAGAVQLTWCEFEVVETALAVRVTRLV